MINKKLSTLRYRKNRAIIAGIDDATKCPCIGSIFVSGVVADTKTIRYWKKIGVKDSKLIAPKKRFKLAEIIKESAAAFNIQEVTPAMIDDKRFNLNDWEMLIVCKIAQELKKQSDIYTMHVDNWEVNTSLFAKRFNALSHQYENDIIRQHNLLLDTNVLSTLCFMPEHRADENYVVVGAASILSKTSSDLQYAKYKEIYGDFGSGSPADPKTRLFVWQHRKNPLPIIRTSWNTFKMLERLNSIEDDSIYARILNKKMNGKLSEI